MLSEGSFDTENWSNDAENSALHYRNKLHKKINKKLQPLVNMSKGGSENKSASFILFIFHLKITKFQLIIEVKQLKVGGKSHCEINAFSNLCWPQLLSPNYCNVLFPR